MSERHLSVVPAANTEGDFARTMRLVMDVAVVRSALATAVLNFVSRTPGSFAERVRKASELSGIPRGVIEQMMKEART